MKQRTDCDQMLQLAEQSQDPALLVVASMCRAKVHYLQGDLVSDPTTGGYARSPWIAGNTTRTVSVRSTNRGRRISARRSIASVCGCLAIRIERLALADEAVTLAEQTSHPFGLGAAHHTMRRRSFLLVGIGSPVRKTFRESVCAIGESTPLGDYAQTCHCL